jgi:hypothetical protein
MQPSAVTDSQRTCYIEMGSKANALTVPNASEAKTILSLYIMIINKKRVLRVDAIIVTRERSASNPDRLHSGRSYERLKVNT